MLPKSTEDPKYQRKSEQLNDIIDSFPDPIPFSTIVAEIEQRLKVNLKANVGEIGLDRSLRLPNKKTGRLTILQTPIDHQYKLVHAQLLLAKKYNRVVSQHSVSSTQATSDVIDECGYERISLHSCGIGQHAIHSIQKRHPNVYL